MRTSLNNIKRIEDFLRGKLEPTESLLFRAKLLLNPDLRRDVYAQRKTYMLIRLSWRRKIRQEVAEIHEQIFYDPGNAAFQNQVRQLFLKQ